MKRFLSSVLLLILLATPSFAEKFTFAVLADNLTAFASYRNVLQEIRDLRVNPDPKFSPVEFVLACGDISPAAWNHAIYRDVFKAKAPSYFPVRGNHEDPRDIKFILQSLLPSLGERIRIYDKKSVNYYADWKNIRLIVLDQYSNFGKSFGNTGSLRWIENAIESAEKADHIFIAFHEPQFTLNSEADPFWSMLLRHKDKVRAVFVGHIHIYYRNRFPDEANGLTTINAGNAGSSNHSDSHQTVVEVMVDGKNVSFRTVQAPDGTANFKIRDQWEIPRSSPAGK